jgi:hypothetical protein
MGWLWWLVLVLLLSWLVWWWLRRRRAADITNRSTARGLVSPGSPEASATGSATGPQAAMTAADLVAHEAHGAADRAELAAAEADVVAEEAEADAADVSAAARRADVGAGDAQLAAAEADVAADEAEAAAAEADVVADEAEAAAAEADDRADEAAAAALATPVYAVGRFGAGSVDPLSDGSMPVGHEIKGNADSMLYHAPESPWYARTEAEVWFADEATAQSAGFARWDSRAAGAATAGLAAPAYPEGRFGPGSVDPLADGGEPVGFPVKGNADSMLYHAPESPWYARTKAEVWFRDEATATAAGFAHWDPAKR